MIRAVVWKEFREQWLIGLALVVLGGGVLVAAATLGDPPRPGAPPLDVLGSLGMGGLAAMMLVVTAGMVCGGALFAAEREAGTLAFLDVLPGRRWRLWGAKVLAGAALALLQTAALLAVAAALGVGSAGFAARVGLYGLLAFVWGTLGSTVARTTLGAVGVAVVAATAATFLFLFPIMLAFAPPGSTLPRPAGWLVFEVLMLTAPLAASGLWFTAPDRARRAGRGRPAAGWRALLWLAWRQARVPALALSGFALVCRFALQVPEVPPVLVWPPLALAAGVLAGVTAFGDEQVHRTGPYWAENRLPVGRAWAAKVAVHAALAAWLLALLLLPAAVRAQFEAARSGGARGTFGAVLHDRLFDELGGQSWKYLLAPAVYGFAAGHLCGLLFRKLVVACGVALAAGGVLAALWVPSLLAGGVRGWQVWLPAAALLLTGRLAVRPWAADRLLGRGPLRRLGWGVGAAAAATAAGLGWRVLEVPDVPGGEDDVAYVAGLPTYDENVAGREFRAAAERYARAAQAADAADPAGAGRRPRTAERLDAVLRGGWAGDPELAAWLDRVFTDPGPAAGDALWPEVAERAAGEPAGMFESPLLVNTAAVAASGLENARRMAVALLARGLQEHAGGDPGAFPRRLATVLALARTVQNGGLQALTAGLEVERLAAAAAERWLERLPAPAAGRAGPARDVARLVEGYDAPGGDRDLRPHHLADRYALREQMRVPGAWLVAGLAAASGAEAAAAEANLVTFAWAVPWERERTRRLLGLGFEQGPEGWPAGAPGLLAGRPGAGLLLGRGRAPGDLLETDRFVRAVRRALAARCALRAHADERGRPPAALADLTAGPDPYLRAVPGDPFAVDRPFGYRVSAGETLRGPRLTVDVRAGEPVLWSVGADGVDQGGTTAPGGPRADDLVFLVPAPQPKN